ncbi:ABC transporter ATP-binding protein [Streptococcus ovuberis]|uniref:ABC transporter ATP-binding protein n=1 Tax=Streptococcus ovuberis TaxID=1936207 RepID=A0A7X6N1M2_9STRE|nr:ABC transporter ATP-binding protein [Streptococcus ovuberis]NKZ20424.1 ABC transporter ATP-binding protein [Streptococcus ovuberis]
MEGLMIKELTLSFPESLVLKQVNLSVAQGQVVTIIGESGSGKTLLTKLMLGMVPEGARVTGEVAYNGVSLLSLSPKALRPILGRRLAYMTQNPMAMFNPFQTIREHFIETILSHRSCSRQEALNMALQAMKELRLGHAEKILQSYAFELSGGMLQRVMLAMLLCLDMEVLILDEPTSALDAYNRENMLRLLSALKAQGKAIVTVTHDYDLARQLGGEMVVMSKGELVERGPAETILTQPSHPYTQELVLGNPYERLVER